MAARIHSFLARHERLTEGAAHAIVRAMAALALALAFLGHVLRKKMAWIPLAVVGTLALIALFFVNQPSFGRLPRGERLSRIEKSPHYRDGKFWNLSATPLMTSNNGGRIRGMIDFLFRDKTGIVPSEPIPAMETDLGALDRHRDLAIWFGHSSYLIQIDGKRLLVDPVFDKAAPVAFANRPFLGTEIYSAEDMPDIDYLIISHDHWDHLDHATVRELEGRVGKVICGLGVGEHFEYWGYPKEKIVELDWQERAALGDGFAVHCLPARHFSGRGLVSDKALWASFLVESPARKIYVGGDGGYDTHFADIGQRFGEIDLAILENGQYNEDWKYIHLMPEYLAQAARDLNARVILTVHHSKYALSTHPWEAPVKHAKKLADEGLRVLLPKIGEPVAW